MAPSVALNTDEMVKTIILNKYSLQDRLATKLWTSGKQVCHLVSSSVFNNWPDPATTLPISVCLLTQPGGRGFGLGIYCSIHSPTCPTLLYCCILLPTCLNLFIAANYFICWSLVWAHMSVHCRRAWFKWHDLQLNHTLSAIIWWAGLMSTYLINIHKTFKH